MFLWFCDRFLVTLRVPRLLHILVSDSRTEKWIVPNLVYDSAVTTTTALIIARFILIMEINRYIASRFFSIWKKKRRTWIMKIIVRCRILNLIWNLWRCWSHRYKDLLPTLTIHCELLRSSAIFVRDAMDSKWNWKACLIMRFCCIFKSR